MNNLAPEIKAVSFDVFDTTITRNLATPKAVFKIMEQSFETMGISLISCGKFYHERVIAEEETRKSCADEEIGLDEIYETLKLRLHISDEQIVTLKQLEIKTELSVSRPIPKTLKLIEGLRGKGLKVLFVSDMYLPIDLVKQLLINAGAFKDGDKLYVSSEYRCGKWSGSLFKLIMSKESLSPHTLLHFGDNRHSDFNVPRKLGIKSKLLSLPKKSRYEKIFLTDDQNIGDSRGQLIAGAIRLSMFAVPRVDKNSSQILTEIGISVAAPLIFFYVSWVLKKAEKEGLERLYFVSRDGQIFFEVAKKIIKKSNQKIEIKYIYGSRQAWHLPALFSINEEALEWILCRDPILTIKIISNRLSFDIEEISTSLAECGLTEIEPDSHLNSRQIDIVKKMLTEKTDLKKKILLKARSARHLVCKYFEQEGMFQHKNWGIVDIGWHGRMYNSLCKILYDYAEVLPPPCFYFGLVCESKNDEVKFPYFFNPESPKEDFFTGLEFLEILEIFTSADHGSTIGYRQEDQSHVFPIFGDIPDYIKSDWGLIHLRNGISTFLSSLGVEHLSIDPDTVKPCLLSLMKTFFKTPNRREAEVIGDFPFSSDQSETLLKPFAPPLKPLQTIKGLFLFPKIKRLYPSFWIYGSFVRSGIVTKIVLYIAIKAFPFINPFMNMISSVLGGPQIANYAPGSCQSKKKENDNS